MFNVGSPSSLRSNLIELDNRSEGYGVLCELRLYVYYEYILLQIYPLWNRAEREGAG